MSPASVESAHRPNNRWGNPANRKSPIPGAAFVSKRKIPHEDNHASTRHVPAKIKLIKRRTNPYALFLSFHYLDFIIKNSMIGFKQSEK
ncbi:hypothetical protein OH687_06370 [Burkholderia anthina]|nr:hypothetical protein OH687_06370 [Burkholderia anthina]